MGKLDTFFGITKNNSTIKIEVVAGITTFLSMAYILAVNPAILADAGMDPGAVFTATALASAIACIVMGVYAKFPVALAPGMGMNAFFTYSVVIGMGYTWQDALFGIFVSGIIFLLISFSGLREQIINVIPPTLKHAVGAGIGLFIAFIGMQSAGIIVANEATLVGLGDFSNPVTLVAVLGLLLYFVLVARDTKAGIFIGMVIIIIAGLILQIFGMDLGIVVPDTVVSLPPSLEPTFGKNLFDVDIVSLLLDPAFWVVVFSFLFVDFFDTAGTLIAVGGEAGLVDSDGNLKNAKKALLVDAGSTTVGSILGTSSVTSFVESVVGIKGGARTGLTSVVVGICFLLASFLSPLLSLVTVSATAPILICVGAMMAVNKGKIDYSDFTNTASAFMTMAMMVLSYSISEGISAGFITYVVCKVATGKYKEVHTIMYVLTGLFMLHYFM